MPTPAPECTSAALRDGAEQATLCFVAVPDRDDAPHLAYFSTRSPTAEWGQDWGSYQFPRDGGAPYPLSPRPAQVYDHATRTWHERHECSGEGTPLWRLSRVPFDPGPRRTINAEESRAGMIAVTDRNAGAVPWRSREPWDRRQDGAAIWAGCSIAEFRRCLEAHGGSANAVTDVMGDAPPVTARGSG